MTLKEFQKYFEGRFLAIIEEKSNGFVTYSNDAAIREALAYVPTFSQGGKYLRPYLLYVGYCSEGGDNDIFSILAGMELFHLFCLVHDDLIDHEIVRRGNPTMHAHLEKVYNNADISRAVAMLVGDLLLAWSVESFEETEQVEPYTVDDAMTEYRTLISEVIHGEMLDVLLSAQDNVSKETIEKKMMLKSAHYSFFRPLYIGMVLAGADSDTKDFAEEYAVGLGMAFQLQDDIADYVTDTQEGQQTLLSWYIRNEASEEYRSQFAGCIATDDWSEEDEKKLVKILKESGALSFAEEKVEEYFLQAEDAIFNHDKNGEEIWQEIIEEIRHVH